MLVGSVERTLVEVVAPISERLIGVAVRRGERVSAGQTLAILDPLLADADLAAAQAAEARARSSAVVASHDFARSRELRRRGVASEQDDERAELARDEAAAGLREASARLAATQKRLDDLVLKAPVDGVVDQIPFDFGERVPAGAVVVVILADGEPWVRVWLPERAIASVGTGTSAEVTIDGLASPLPGRVVDVAREPEFTPHYALTERERTHLVYETRVAIEGASATLRPGTPAEVRIPLGAAP